MRITNYYMYTNESQNNSNFHGFLWKGLQLNHWVAGAGSDTTVVVAVTAHLDVAVHSPGLTPAA